MDDHDDATGRSPVELMIIDRAVGRAREAECGSCGRLALLSHGLFVSSQGEPCGAVEICDECAPRVSRVVENMVDLLPVGVASMLTKD